MSNKLLGIIIAIIAMVFLAPLIISSQRNNEPERERRAMMREQDTELVQCLSDAGVVVYGSETCPACAQFAMQFGGYEAIEPIYVECSDNPEECDANMQTEFVPEIQINGIVTEERSKAGLADQTGCPYKEPEN